jgi:hypothetical protein
MKAGLLGRPSCQEMRVANEATNFLIGLQRQYGLVLNDQAQKSP